MKSVRMDSMRPITSFLRIGLGGIWFHGSLLQGGCYFLHVGRNGGTIQVCGPADKNGGRFVYASIHISTRSLPTLRREMWRLAQASKNWQFSCPKSEAVWQQANTA